MKKFFYTLIGIIVSSVLSAADFDDQVGDNQTGTPPINIIKIDPNIPFNPHYINDDRFADTSGYTYTPEPLDDGLVNLVIQQAPSDIQIIIEGLKNLESKKNTLPKTVLLMGKPGVGKSTLPVALAQKFSIPCTFVKCSLIADRYQNSGPQNLNLIIQPLLLQTSDFRILVLDELGSIAQSGDDEHQKGNTASALLQISDEINKKKANILVFATTNKTTNFPEAIKSRFEWSIEFPLPSNEVREKIVNYYLDLYNLSCSDAIRKVITRATENFSSRDIDGCIKKIALQTSDSRTITPDILKNTFSTMRNHPALRHLYESYSSRALSWIKDNHTVVLGVSTGIIVPAVIFYLGWRLNQAHQKMIEAHQQEAFELQKAHQQESLELQKQSVDTQKNQMYLAAGAVLAPYILQGIQKAGEWSIQAGTWVIKNYFGNNG